MKRLRLTLLIALTLIAIGSARVQAKPTLVLLDPASPHSTTDPGTSDSGEPDIGQGKNGPSGQNSVSLPVTERLAKAVQWVRVIWSTRYLGIGF